MIVLIILLIGLILTSTLACRQMEGFENWDTGKAVPQDMDFRFMTKLVPFHNPFATTFFHQKEHLFRVYASQIDLHRPLIIRSIGPHLVSGALQSPLDSLNNYNLDFVIDTELNIAPKYMGKKVHNNLRFVCSLYKSSLLLIAPNSSNIIDLGDIKHYTCKVSIGVAGDRSTEQYQAVVQILSAYGEQTTKNINIVNLDRKALMEGYGTTFIIYADLTTSKSSLIRALTDKIPSHLVSLHKINTGGYHVTYQEKPFYKRYPYYRKEMIDIIQLRRNYPLLSQVHNRDLYYPTIRTGYALLCHDKVPDSKIQNILHQILILMYEKGGIVSQLFKGITIIDLGHISTVIPIHQGAEQVYRDIQLHDRSGTSYYRGSQRN